MRAGKGREVRYQSEKGEAPKVYGLSITLSG